MNITAFPNDIFLLIVIPHLSPKDLILNRRVSKQFYAAFTESDLNRHALQQHYPRARELRDGNERPWSKVLNSVAARYHQLKSGSPESIEKWALLKSFVAPSWAKHYPVANWQRYLQFEDKTAPFHYPDPLWTYDDGILIFPSAELQSYVLYDLIAGVISEIDFQSESKIVRRIRLKEKVLIVEWCEEQPYHQLNENEVVYRHFASAYDLVRSKQRGPWALSFRYVQVL
jgi:hypothetical protein